MTNEQKHPYGTGHENPFKLRYEEAKSQLSEARRTIATANELMNRFKETGDVTFLNLAIKKTEMP